MATDFVRSEFNHHLYQFYISRVFVSSNIMENIEYIRINRRLKMLIYRKYKLTSLNSSTEVDELTIHISISISILS